MSLTRVSPRNGSAAAGPCRLTILRHHRIFADGDRPLYRLGVPERVFGEQVHFLATHGLTPITVDEGVRHLGEGRPGHKIALTFDDGYADNIERALPILKDAGARATFYLTAGLMERRRAPWWDEVAHALESTKQRRLAWRANGGAALDLPLDSFEDRQRALAALTGQFKIPPPSRDERLASLAEALGVSDPAPCGLATWHQAAALPESGMEVGAHTMTHPHLTTLDVAGQTSEIRESADLIASRLGVRPAGFAYPGGDYDQGTLVALEASGLSHAVTTRAGDNRPGAPVLELRRRGFTEGNCLAPGGRFSRRLALAEIDGAFDRLRAARAVGVS